MKRYRQKFVAGGSRPLDAQKSEYVFDVVVPAGAVEAGADALGCCTVFSSLTLHAPRAAARERATSARRLIGGLLILWSPATAGHGEGCEEPQAGAQR